MKQAYATAVVILWFSAIGCEIGRAEDTTQLSAEITIRGSKISVVATTGSGGKCANASDWQWGADGCPTTILYSLTVRRADQRLWVPVSAYLDLAEVTKLQIAPVGSGFEVKLFGGDAGTSYSAVLVFDTIQDVTLLRRRVVRSGEFPAEAWEETTYSFNLGKEEEPPIKP